MLWLNSTRTAYLFVMDMFNSQHWKCTNEKLQSYRGLFYCTNFSTNKCFTCSLSKPLERSGFMCILKLYIKMNHLCCALTVCSGAHWFQWDTACTNESNSTLNILRESNVLQYYKCAFKKLLYIIVITPYSKISISVQWKEIHQFYNNLMTILFIVTCLCISGSS